MKTILVALEPESSAQRIWQRALTLATKYDATLHVINVLKPATHFYAQLDFAPLFECSADWAQEVVRQRRRYFQDLCTDLEDDRLHIELGDPAEQIAQTANALGAELLVMGLHNRTGIKHLLGSTTAAVLGRVDADLLAVHPDRANTAYRSVLAAIDISEPSGYIAQTATRAAENAARIELISVRVPLQEIFASPGAYRSLDWSYEGLMRDLERETRAHLTQLRSRYCPLATIAVPEGAPRREILLRALGVEADLIVMGHAAPDRLFIGSVAKSILDRAPCDVWVTRNPIQHDAFAVSHAYEPLDSKSGLTTCVQNQGGLE